MGAMREFKPLAKMNPILLNKPKQIIGMAKLKSFNAQLSIYIYPHAYPPIFINHPSYILPSFFDANDEKDPPGSNLSWLSTTNSKISLPLSSGTPQSISP